MGKSATDDTATETDKPKAAAPEKEAAPEGSDKKADDSSLSHDEAPLEISLKGYLRSSGKRADQMAGFESFANRELSGRRTQKDWEQAFSDFCAKPVR